MVTAGRVKLTAESYMRLITFLRGTSHVMVSCKEVIVPCKQVIVPCQKGMSVAPAQGVQGYAPPMRKLRVPGTTLGALVRNRHLELEK